MTLTLVPSDDLQRLIPLLHDAEEGDERIAEVIRDPTMTAYILYADDVPVGAVVIQWVIQDSEIIYIATDTAVRGRGYGKAIIRLLLDEARQRGIEAVSVGTANSSWNNIAFYQKCGFRMHSVRQNYFDYLPAPQYENGIRMQDMLVLRILLIDKKIF